MFFLFFHPKMQNHSRGAFDDRFIEEHNFVCVVQEIWDFTRVFCFICCFYVCLHFKMWRPNVFKIISNDHGQEVSWSHLKIKKIFSISLNGSFQRTHFDKHFFPLRARDRPRVKKSVIGSKDIQIEIVK